MRSLLVNSVNAPIWTLFLAVVTWPGPVFACAAVQDESGDNQTFELRTKNVFDTEFLRDLDGPVGALESSKPDVRSYRCGPDQLSSLAAELQNRFGAIDGVSIRADVTESRLVVVASTTMHQQIESTIRNSGTSFVQPETVTETGPAQAIEFEWSEFALTEGNPLAVHEALLALFDTQLIPTRFQDGILFGLKLPADQLLQFGWTGVADKVYFTGPPAVAEQFLHLIKQLIENKPGEMSPRILAYRQGNSFPIRNVLRAYGVLPERNPEGVAPNPTGPFLPVSFGKRWSYQEPIPAPTLLPLPQQPNPQVGPQDQQNALLRELRDSVQVETLPDLGIIILRGRQKEVDELSRIIQELERLSAEALPEVRIIDLKYTRGEAIQDIIEATSADLASSRQGRVTVTSLVKPNALLLIGWGEAMQSVADLIAKLDQPVTADTQFEVFRLLVADSTQIQAVIANFFANREGLGPTVQTVTDSRSNSIIAYAAPRDMEEIRRLIQNLDVPNYRKKQQAIIVKVQNSTASELALTLQNAIKAARGTGPQQTAILELLVVDSDGQKILRSGVLDDVQVTPNPVNNTLIVSGPQESMELMEALIHNLDVIGSTAQIKVFRIENGDAATLVQMLRSLLPEQTLERPSLKLASDPNEVSLAPLRFSVDTRTNSIIATGSEGDLRIIEALLVRLDEKEFSQRRNSVYRLKNAPAVDVAEAINNFLRSERQAQQLNSATSSPFEQIEREVVVVPEPVGNRLILSATPRYFEEVEDLINQLDEPPPQVMIQVLIAEVSLDNADEFGIELGLQDSILFDRSLLGSLVTTTTTTQQSTPAGIVTATEEIIQAATNDPGFGFNNAPLGNSGSSKSLATAGSLAGQGISNFAVGRINNELGFGGLVLSASSESISVLIRALEECRRLEVLSRPMVRTLDNQPAFIQVGQRVPRIIGSTVNQNGQSNSIALENVGLILGVTPRISPDGTVVMEIDAERSGLGPETEGIPVSVSPTGSVIRSPRVDTTTAQATVSASSGETIILGGLITKKTQEFSRRVPYLSKIPLLGNLFRYDSNVEKRTELIIVLTPYVIKGPEDEQRLKQMEFGKMNWCYSDVNEIHGDLGETGPDLPMMLDVPAEQTIYPDQLEEPVTDDPMFDRQPVPLTEPDVQSNQ